LLEQTEPHVPKEVLEIKVVAQRAMQRAEANSHEKQPHDAAGEERRGPFVAREALDPDFDYKPEVARKLMADFLRGVDYTKNPYLRSPKDMLEDGFEGTPYTL